MLRSFTTRTGTLKEQSLASQKLKDLRRRAVSVVVCHNLVLSEHTMQPSAQMSEAGVLMGTSKLNSGGFRAGDVESGDNDSDGEGAPVTDTVETSVQRQLLSYRQVHRRLTHRKAAQIIVVGTLERSAVCCVRWDSPRGHWDSLLQTILLSQFLGLALDLSISVWKETEDIVGSQFCGKRAHVSHCQRGC